MCTVQSGGLCNIHGGINCSSCGPTCKNGYFGNQCQFCNEEFTVSNDVMNGTVDIYGEGPLCKGTSKSLF